MRYLAIDPGDKRTGLAVGDDLTGHAGPVDVIETSDPATLLRGIAEAIEDQGPDELVVGVPYDMDGKEGAAAKKSLALALLLESHTGLVVHRVDERLTSFEADERMKQSGLTHKQKKSRRDAIAAAAILEDFLARRRESGA
ncbi:MAG: Holliday junction resolvase RuvX [Planctomycetes bacterium]|nr:Holliday junction resolvase RuvX [Planctomycetota bacterium]